MTQLITEIDYNKYVERVIQRLQGLVQIPSILDGSTSTADEPYGQAIAKALDYMKNLAQEDGFTTRNVDGHVLVVESPMKKAIETDSSKRIDIVSHLDVVEVGANWTRDPFGGEIEGDRMYGRGTSDMKRAAIIMQTVLQILADYDIPLKNQIRLVYGTDEETNMTDLPYYIEKEGAPDFAITPDGTFPMSMGEKGASTWQIRGKLPEDSIIIDIKGGTAANVIPSICKVTVKSKDFLTVQQYREQTGWPIEMAPMEAGLQITVKGIGGHASQPQVGENAIVRALQLVADVFNDSFARELLTPFKEYDGSSINMVRSTPEMGSLTINLGHIDTNIEGNLLLEMDSRFPQNTTSDEITAALKIMLPVYFDVQTTFDTPAILHNLNRPAIQTIRAIFQKQYPAHSQDTFLSSGVTYSKVVPNCIAFGMSFEDEEIVAHQADEYVRLDNIAELLQLYTEVLVQLGQADGL